MPIPDPVDLFATLVDAVGRGRWTAAGRARDALRAAGYVVSLRPDARGRGADLPAPAPAGGPARQRNLEIAGGDR